MGRIFFLICFIVISQTALTQEYISGTVVDADTGNPISDVIVQYGSASKDYDYTGRSGRFTIPSLSSGVISFQCIGYKSVNVLLQSIVSDPVVKLEPDPVSLNPVIIDPRDADRILEEVMINTKKKLLTKQPLCYLLHFTSQNTADTTRNEMYLQYAATLDAKDLRKSMKDVHVPYKYNLKDIAVVERTVVPVSEMYGAEYHASHLFSFGKSENNETTRSYTTDSTLIILNISPVAGKGGWAEGEVVINREEMTLISMEIQSVDSILESEPYKRYMGKELRIARKVGRFGFKKQNDMYYMSDCYTYYKFDTKNEQGRQDEITYHCDVSFQGFIGKKQLRDRQLSGFCQELFYFPESSTTVEFWNENTLFDPGLSDLEMEYLGLKPKGYDNPSSATRLWRGVKGSVKYLPAFGVLYIIQRAAK